MDDSKIVETNPNPSHAQTIKSAQPSGPHDTTTVQGSTPKAPPLDGSPVKTHLEDPPAGSHYEKSVAEHNAEVDEKSREQNKHYKQ